MKALNPMLNGQSKRGVKSKYVDTKFISESYLKKYQSKIHFPGKYTLLANTFCWKIYGGKLKYIYKTFKTDRTIDGHPAISILELFTWFKLHKI